MRSGYEGVAGARGRDTGGSGTHTMQRWVSGAKRKERLLDQRRERGQDGMGWDGWCLEMEPLEWGRRFYKQYTAATVLSVGASHVGG